MVVNHWLCFEGNGGHTRASRYAKDKMGKQRERKDNLAFWGQISLRD